MFVAFIDKILFSFPDYFPVYVMVPISYKDLLGKSVLQVVCTVALRANMVEANIPPHGFLSSSTMLCTSKVRRILAIVRCTLSNIALAWCS